MKTEFRIVEQTQPHIEKPFKVQRRGLLWGWNDETRMVKPRIFVPVRYATYEEAADRIIASQEASAKLVEVVRDEWPR